MQPFTGNSALAAGLLTSGLLVREAVAAPLAAPAPAYGDVVSNLHARNETSGKRVINWDWSLTEDLGNLLNVDNIMATGELLMGSEHFSAIFNWENWTPTEITGMGGKMFQPMAQTPEKYEDTEWLKLEAALDAQSSDVPIIVHFLNEPERIPVTESDAVDLWQKMLELRSSRGVELVGPACASDGAQWCDNFMNMLDDASKPDYMGVHFYTAQESSGADEDVEAAQTYIEDQMKYGIPVVISEIASTSRTQENVNSFTEQMMEWLDGNDDVKQYGFFGLSVDLVDDFVSPAAQLMDSEGNLTDLGNMWVG